MIFLFRDLPIRMGLWVKNINEILKINEKLVDFTYIDNSNIEIYNHLWEGNLHLNTTGLDVLLVNFVNALNRSP